MKIYINFLYIIIILLAAMSACNQSNKNNDVFFDEVEPVIIDVVNLKESNTPLRLSQFAEDISYILLSDEVLIGDLKSTSIHVFEDTIYINGTNIFKYSPEGKFIQTLFKEGQGPNEALKHEISSAIINKKERYFTFFAKSLEYRHYTLNGHFAGKSEFAIDRIRKKEIEAYFNDFCIYRIEYSPSSDNGNMLGSHLFYVEDLLHDSIFYAYPNPAANENPPFNGRLAKICPADMNFIHIDSTFWFKHYALDTLYCTNDFKFIKPRYIFKTDNTFMNLREYTQLRVVALDKKRYSAKVITGILPLPTGDLLFTIDKKIALADNLGITTGCTEKYIVNDIDEYLKEIDIAFYLNNRKYSVCNNHLYILADAFKFYESGNKPPLKELTEDSNPVIIKLKLKKSE